MDRYSCEVVTMDGQNTSIDQVFTVMQGYSDKMSAPFYDNPILLWVFIGAYICLIIGIILVFIPERYYV